MSPEAVFEQIKTQAENASSFGGTLKFVIDGNPIYIDGSGENNEVSKSDAEAQCTVITSSETLGKLQSGALNPMMAVMGGDIRIEGDMGLAMKLQSVLG